MTPNEHKILNELEEIDDFGEQIIKKDRNELTYDGAIDLNALEELKNKENFASIKQKDESFSDLILFQNFIKKMNVRLQEVIDKVFDKSLSYCVVVRDDKVIYANNSFLNLIECDDYLSIYNKKFFSFIHKEDWDFLAENIGEMLTNNLELQVRISTLKDISINVNLKALYIQDGKHFTFALFGNKIYSKKDIQSVLYDTNTGLPSYYLFEDRLQELVNAENRKKKEERKTLAVAAIYIDNLEKVKDKNSTEAILRKISEKLVLSLDKSYTVSIGMENHFWVLFPNVRTEDGLKKEIKKIISVFEGTISDGGDEHNMVASVGASLYPKPAATVGRLLEITSKALKKAQKDGGNKVVFITE